MNFKLKQVVPNYLAVVTMLAIQNTKHFSKWNYDYAAEDAELRDWTQSGIFLNTLKEKYEIIAL